MMGRAIGIGSIQNEAEVMGMDSIIHGKGRHQVKSFRE